MKTKNKLMSSLEILYSKLVNKSIPVAVRWQLTNRCPLSCIYCSIPCQKEAELTTSQILCGIDQLVKMGTQVISFSGGDPLLRDDIDIILKYAKNKGISCEMNSNGILVKKKVDSIKHLNLLKLSLDGPEKINDVVRGKNTFKKVIEAADTARSNKIKFTFATTITKYNVNHLDFMLKLAKKYNTMVAFQPVKELYKRVKSIEKIRPKRDDYVKNIKMLIREKKRGNKHIRNSIYELNYILNWPNYPKLKCTAGKIFCMIMTNGDVIPCDRILYTRKPLNYVNVGFKEAFKRMPEIEGCSGCGFCGALELNYLYSLRLGILREILRLVK